MKSNRIRFSLLVLLLTGLSLLALTFIEASKQSENKVLENDSENSILVVTPRSEVFVQIHGKGQKTVLLVHSLFLVGSSFNKVVSFLAEEDLRIITWDIAGHGASKRLVDDVSIKGHAEDLIAIADELGLDEYSVIGHSYGGRIAQRAVELDNRIVALGLVSSWHGPLPTDEVRALRLRFKVSLFLKPLLKILPKKIVPEYVHETARSPNLGDGKDLEACMTDRAAKIRDLKGGVSILHGSGDYTIPASLGFAAANVWEGRYGEIDTIAHQLPYVKARETADFILRLCCAQ
jgi:pimeloyl-ACP methyl ester carboxylesterase